MRDRIVWFEQGVMTHAKSVLVLISNAFVVNLISLICVLVVVA
jgi:hypothetical protein